MGEMPAKIWADEGFAEIAAIRTANDIAYYRADLVEPLVEALRVAIGTFALTEREKIEDPQYGEYIRSIGDKIGYGALMSGAQAEWRKRLREDGGLVGGEFVAGPCYVTVLDTLKHLRAALQAYESAQ